MKKVLLVGINAKYIHSNPAIYSLKAYVQKYMPGATVEIAEYTINQNKETIMADIYRRKPEVAAFSCYIWNWSMVQEVMTQLPKILSDTDIWLGGPEVSFDAEKVLKKYPMITGIMVGEGEETFAELYTYYQKKDRELNDIKGLVLPSGYTGDRALLSMNEIPFLYDDLGQFRNRIIYYESQRGCPFRCAYCLSSIDKSVRLRDIDTVKEHLQFFLDQKVEQVKFIDRTFNCNAKHAYEIWKYLKEHDNGVTNFHFEIAADLLTKEQLELMSDMRPGLIQLEIGVQSTNEATLHAICRYASLEQLRETVAKVRGYRNIHQHLDLIAGLPYEDYETFAKSFDEVYAMKPQQLQLGFLKVLKGSPMEEKAQEYGIVYHDTPPYEVLYTEWLPYEDVLRLKGVEEMVELYYNSAQFAHVLPVLEQEFSSAFAMYEALAAYYEEHGYFISVPSRMYRYQVLLEFAIFVNPQKEQLYRQLLTFDLYLRENVKSRPSFAVIEIAEQADVKERLRAFYQQEEKELDILKGYEGFSSIQLAKMTHVEVFTYAVWEENGAKALDKPAYVLFDYKMRDALTHDARVVCLYI